MMAKSSSAAKHRRAGIRRGKDTDAIEDSNNSVGSAVLAPDWPPVKQKNSSSHKKEGNTTKGGAGEGSSGAERAKEFLRKASASAQAMKLEAWEGMGHEDLRERDRLLALGTKSRRDLDEYDVEYDRGKVKKVKSMGKVEPPIDSGVFDKQARAAQQLRKGGRGRRCLKAGERTRIDADREEGCRYCCSRAFIIEPM
jgi:hypothetical protein